MKTNQVTSISALAACALFSLASMQTSAQQTDNPLAEPLEFDSTTLAAQSPADCPAGVELLRPARTVLQVIDLEVHRWVEYDLAGRALCIVQERPRQKILSAAETAELLQRSRSWESRLPDPELIRVVPADDPSVTAPPAPAPALSHPPEGWSENHGSDRDHQRPSPPTRSETSEQPGPATPSTQNRQLPVSNEAAPQVVIGDDDRTRVSQAVLQSYPWNTIGYHRHQYPNDETYRCTAFLVGPHLALTNGHCIYNDDRGGYLRAAEFSPGQFQSGEGEPIVRPYGTLPAYRFRTNAGYVDDGFSIYDYGGLNFSRGFDAITTYMPLVFDDPGANTVNTSGYPSRVHVGEPEEENPTFSQWYSFSSETSIGGTDDRLIYHDADTIGGHSGSPLWRLPSGENRRVIAIHCCGSSTSQINWGPRLVSANQGVIEGWLDWLPPANPGIGDDFGELSSDSAAGSWASSNLGATLQIGEADHCGFEAGRSMWRSWTSPVSRPVEFFMTDTDFDVLLGAYTGNAVNTASEVACDGSGGTGNSIAFNATAGQTYHIAIDGWSGEEGGFRLNWRVAPPPNDDFANSWSMPGSSGADAGDNFGATAEGGEPEICGYSTESIVWWHFTAPAEPGTLEIDTTGSDFDVLLGAYSGPTVDALTEIDCDGSVGSDMEVTVTTAPGGEYRIAVAGWNGSSGNIQLNWNWQASGDDIFGDRFEQ